MKNPIICVDFDGVIHSYTSGWKGVAVIPDDPVPGAIDWLMEHLPIPEALGGCFAPDHTGPVVQIYSSRSKSWFGRTAMKNWLVKHGLPRQYISDGILQFPTKKPAAFLTIDDRAICFNGKFPTKEEMLGFKPWYKKQQAGGSPVSFDDRGEMTMEVFSRSGRVVVSFGAPVHWMGLTPDQAVKIGETLLQHAAGLRAEYAINQVQSQR